MKFTKNIYPMGVALFTADRQTDIKRRIVAACNCFAKAQNWWRNCKKARGRRELFLHVSQHFILLIGMIDRKSERATSAELQMYKSNVIECTTKTRKRRNKMV